MTRQPTPSLTSPERRRPTLSRPVGPRPHAPIWAARPRSPPGRSTSRRTLGRRRDAQPPIGGRCGPPPPPASDLRGRSGGQDASPRSMRSARPFVPSNCQKARRRTRRCSETAAENRPRAIRANAVSRAYSAPPRCLLSASRREAALSQARRPAPVGKGRPRRTCSLVRPPRNRKWPARQRRAVMQVCLVEGRLVQRELSCSQPMMYHASAIWGPKCNPFLASLPTI
jgi:hypothetical protein